MGYFEYVMVLISIIVGLGLTHVLGALGAAVHRLRGHGLPIRLDATYLLWVGTVLTWLVSFWWFEFKYQEITTQWTLDLYLFVTFYAISLYLMAVILLPAGMKGITDSYEYFMAGRRWFFGAFFVATAFDVVDSFLKGFDWGMQPSYLTLWAIYIAAGIVGIVSKTRGVQRLAAAVPFVSQIVNIFSDLRVLGSW
jgi:hypothetical protein